jgi:uncharacterized membrane protein (UPF0136 family)
VSNVLIGIIGVILFIGLALAGALILGDEFKSSRSSTTAATITSQMQQISAAINMRNLKTGTTMSAVNYETNVAALTPRFLKSAPTVPMSGVVYRTVDVDGFGRDLPIHHLQARLGPLGDEVAKSVCREIEAQSGAADPDAAIAAVTTQGEWTTRVNGARKVVGCFLYTANGVNAYNAFLLL